METIKIEHGYVIKSKHENSYYEETGLGDWALTGDEQTACIFTDKGDAEKVMVSEVIDDGYSIIEVTRATLFFSKTLTDKQLELLRTIVK